MANFTTFNTDENYSKNALKFSLITFGVISLVLSLYFYFLFPGILNEDYFHLLSLKSKGASFSLQSNLYSFFIFLHLEIFGSSGAIGFFQLLLSSSTLAFITYNLVKFNVSRMVIVLTISPFIILPSIFLYNFSYNRDILFSWLVLLLLSIIFFEYVREESWERRLSIRRTVVILSLATVIEALRIDGVVFLLGTLCFYLKVYGFNKESILKVLLPFSLIYLLLNNIIFLPFNSIYKSFPVVRSYYITVAANPLSYIMRNRKIVLTTEDKKSIEDIILIEDLTRYESDLNIPMVHEKKLKSNISNQKLLSFFKVFTKISFNNLDLFLMNRFKMIFHTFGIGRNTLYLLEDKVISAKDNSLVLEFRSGLVNKVKFLKLMTSTIYGDFSRNLIWSSAWSLFLFVGCLFYRDLKVVRILSLLLILRTSIVFLLAPATHFIYLFSNHLCGFLFLSFILIELKERRRVRS